jgi:hypothetical protein
MAWLPRLGQCGLVIMAWLKRLFGGSASEEPLTAHRAVTVENPLAVQSPKIGYFNLLGPSGQSIIDEDKRALERLFPSFEENSSLSACNVLMIYARINEDGSIVGCADGLRDIIRKSGAVVVVVASDNPPKAYFAAAKRTGYGQANPVMTLQRKGSAFPTFFAELFEKMWKGTTMPVAWVQLVPQGPGLTHDGPELIFAAEISHIVFT